MVEGLPHVSTPSFVRIKATSFPEGVFPAALEHVDASWRLVAGPGETMHACLSPAGSGRRVGGSVTQPADPTPSVAAHVRCSVC
jgi:hypothetical protein